MKPVEPRTCRLDSCDVVFTPTGPGSHLRRYCDVHFVGGTDPVIDQTQPWHKTTKASIGNPHCIECGNRIPISRMSTAKYCSNVCKNRAAVDRRLATKAMETQLNDLPDDVTYRMMMARKGDFFVWLENNPEVVRQLLSGELTQAELARREGQTAATVSRSFSAIKAEMARGRKATNWLMSDESKAMIPIETLDRLIEIGPDHPHVDGLVAEAAAAFWEFEHRFFTIGSRQDRFIVKLFHREIVDGMIRAFAFGSRLLVLTPPRHGKSELVIRFVAWLIVMYPNIQILWVAANKDLAIQMTSKLKATFEFNADLRKTFLPPGKKFGDKGCVVWQKHEFTLYTRTDPTLKSPTFTGLGSTSTVAGRDCDFIGVDDLEERKTVATSDLREKSRLKHSEIMERQEGHTGVVTIGSRQHTDDIPHHLMEEDGEDAWEIMVYPAHDELGCQVVDPEDSAGHVDCMLMPEIRPYRWMMARESEAIALGFPGRFPLRYLQQPVPEDGTVFNMAVIKEKCFDRSRGLGMEGLPPMRLIAGLDPAPRGTQVAFLWGWDGTTLHMIDYQPQTGREEAGADGAMQIMKKWGDLYDLRHWIHEDNSGQIDAWQLIERYRNLVRDQALIVKPHTTGMNKHDPESGITSMSSWYHEGRISLPYGTGEARQKVKGLMKQLELWTSDGLAKKGKTDIKMAHWLPFPTITKWAKADRTLKLQVAAEASYPGLSSFDQPGWSTPYPGGM